MAVSKALKKSRYKVNLPLHLSCCEFNYQRLRRLLPNVASLSVGSSREYILGNDERSESRIRFNVVEQTKYTTVVHIVQHCYLQDTPVCLENESVQKSTCANESDVSPMFKLSPLSYQGDVRLYHDAILAEVVKCQRYHQFSPRYEYPNVDMHQVDEKAQMNRFLAELLTHCLSCGRVSEVIVD